MNVKSIITDIIYGKPELIETRIAPGKIVVNYFVGAESKRIEAPPYEDVCEFVAPRNHWGESFCWQKGGEFGFEDSRIGVDVWNREIRSGPVWESPSGRPSRSGASCASVFAGRPDSIP